MTKHNPHSPTTVPHQATWRFSGVEWNEVGKLEVFLPARNTHPDLHIKAKIEDCDGDLGYWEVIENNELVAVGQINCGDPLWRNGEGPQLEAERVICYGPTDDDRVRAKSLRRGREETIKPQPGRRQ